MPHTLLNPCNPRATATWAVRSALACVVSLLLFAPAASAGPQESASRPAEPIRVGAAISLREVMESIVRDHSGPPVLLSFGSSGQLLAQIRGGAPIDIFISAAAEQMDALQKENLLIAGTRRVIALNRLVLIVPADEKKVPSSFESLGDPTIGWLAIGDPLTVPAGQYAKQVLAKLGVERALAGRLVYGTNVRQVLDYVARGEVSAGLVYATDARTTSAVRVAAEADPSWHAPIEYSAAVLKQARSIGDARKLLDELGGPVAAAAFERHGFEMAKNGDPSRPVRDGAVATRPAASVPTGARAP